MKKMSPEHTDNSDIAKNKLHVFMGSVLNIKTEKYTNKN